MVRPLKRILKGVALEQPLQRWLVDLDREIRDVEGKQTIEAEFTSGTFVNNIIIALEDLIKELIMESSASRIDYSAIIADIETRLAMISQPRDYTFLWPVGSIFISVVATNPAILLGFGTWVAFGTGRFLVGIDTGDADFDVVKETGGAKTHKHSVDVASTVSGGPSAPTAVASGTGATVATSTHTHNVDPAAVDSTIVSNIPPYIVCYFWERQS